VVGDRSAPALLVITGKIGNFQLKRVLPFPCAGIDLDQELAWINVRGSLDLGSTPFAGAQLDFLGSLEFKMKEICKVVPMDRMNRIEMELSLELLPESETTSRGIECVDIRNRTAGRGTLSAPPLRSLRSCPWTRD
tara:strand:- start:300 stop:707 length:408 start_codon:yes stop_codon:yes gene_type:complete